MFWILLLLAAVLAAVLLLLRYGYKLAFYYDDPQEDPLRYDVSDQLAPDQETLDDAVREFLALPFEAVSIRSRDGLVLTGQYYHISDGAPLQILCHGYKGNAIRDFCGGSRIARELGHNVLLIDQRCHGNSQGHTITFGIRERQDVLDWVSYAHTRFGPVPTILSGVSMGAATVLMASAMDLPEQVKAVIADCPYDAPENIIKKVLGTDMGMNVKLVYPLIRLGGIVWGGFDLAAASPLEAVKTAKVPILLIHGNDDRFVPYAMSENLHAAARGKLRFHTVKGAGHALNYVKDPQGYSAVVKKFLAEILC